MALFEIASAPQQPRKLTRCARQITALPYLYQAELVRVPGIRCGVIGLLASDRQSVQPAIASRARAEDYVGFLAVTVWPHAGRRRGHATLPGRGARPSMVNSSPLGADFNCDSAP